MNYKNEPDLQNLPDENFFENIKLKSDIEMLDGLLAPQNQVQENT